jgi:hypothetical protein
VSLSLILTLDTAFPHVPLSAAAPWLVASLAAVLLLSAALGALWKPQGSGREGDAGSARTWTMPPIESLAPPVASSGRTLGLVVLRCYLLTAAAILVVKTVQIAVGSG